MTYSRSLYNSETRNTAQFINDGDTQTVGTYFNWKAATGGMGDMTNTSRPGDSVCPKGWQLPVYSNDKSWDNLIRVVYSAETFTAGNAGANQANYQTTNGAHIYAMSQTLRRAPLSMPFSGSFQFYSGKTVAVAGYGFFWSSTSYSTPGARYLSFYSNSLGPQNGSSKGNGFPVRCVVEIFIFISLPTAGTNSEKKHSSSTDAVTEDATTNANAMTYSRSLYSSDTRNTANFINDGDTQTIGTYFNWKTATGGMGDMTNTNRPDDSVCPKGWQLPVDATSGKSYRQLIDAYYDGVYGSAWSGNTYYQTENGAHIYAMSQALRRAPLSIPFSGNFQFSSGKTARVASYGYFWSSTSYSTTYARYLYFYSHGLYPQFYLYKGNGVPVRCVAEK